MSDMLNPPHPGETLREDVLPALGLTVTEAARQLGVRRSALSRVLNGRAAISPDMALCLETWLGEQRGARAELWLTQQMAFDIWRARQKPQPEIARIQAVLRANGGIGWGLIRSTAQSLIVQLGAAIRISILRYSSREMRHQLPRFCKDSKRVATIGSPPIRRRF